jgi:hypothetical protein
VTAYYDTTLRAPDAAAAYLWLGACAHAARAHLLACVHAAPKKPQTDACMRPTALCLLLGPTAPAAQTSSRLTSTPRLTEMWRG